jgi:hypothetical protein
VPQQTAATRLDAPGALVYQGRDAKGAIEDSPMAIDPKGGHPAMDYAEHLRTYGGFLKATTILIVLVALLLLYLLTLVP